MLNGMGIRPNPRFILAAHQDRVPWVRELTVAGTDR